MAKSSTSSGISFFGLLGVTFVVLKLTEVIDWSWWWVLAPLWFWPVLIIGGLIIYGVIMVSHGVYKRSQREGEEK